jgi:hypothetical protein
MCIKENDMNILTEVLCHSNLIKNWMIHSEWLLANGRRRPDARQVKIREDVVVIQNMLKTPGGLIIVTAVNENRKLHDVHFSGDYFFFPAEDLAGLEQSLEGVAVETEMISAVVVEYYTARAVESPGVLPQDFARVLVPASA